MPACCLPADPPITLKHACSVALFGHPSRFTPAALLAAAALVLLLVRRRQRARGTPSPNPSPSRRSGRFSRGPSGRMPSGQLPQPATADPASQGLLPFGSEMSARLARESALGPGGSMEVGTPRFWGAARPEGDRHVPPGLAQELGRPAC